MIHTIRTSKLSKVIASYLAIQLMLTTVQPSNLFALTSGPSQPEFNSFTPIGTSDMVNLSTGDFNYNIPIMDVGGYPLNLAYDSGVTMDQEASWVGLGWNLNVGQINRQVRGIPDDFKGDTLTYEKNLKKHVTVGINAELDAQIFGLEGPDNIKRPENANGGFSAGLGIKYSNYHGITFTPSYGLSFDLSDNISVGVDVQTSATEGATISPSVNAKADLLGTNAMFLSGSLNAGLSYNSNRGLTNFGLSASLSPTFSLAILDDVLGVTNGGTVRGSLSFSNPMPITPRKRSAFKDLNATFSYAFGVDIWGADGQVELSATASVQELKDKVRKEKAYGYEFSGQATQNDILDYNRENDRTISKNLLALPYTNYTYDLYSVNGQGASGMFRAHRSQVGQIYDQYVEDESASFNLGGEGHGGPGSFQLGANLVIAPSKSHTGIWNTTATNTFKNENENLKANNELDYEPVYFKYVGENKVDYERELYTEKLHGDKAIAVNIGGTGFNKYADTRFRVKEYESNIPKEKLKSFSGVFKRTKRDIRNQSIQKITAAELRDFYTNKYGENRINTHAKDHHTAEIRLLKPDGATYVFGETAYNTLKQEVTFATRFTGDCASGIVKYNDPENPDLNLKENSIENDSGIDNFFDKVETPAYAHTYLLSAVLSSDYEDIDGDGPTDNDLGAYTLFKYKKLKYQNAEGKEEDFQWRIPFGKYEASYNEGLRSSQYDQKGSYLYGKKEIKYIQKIETKTHVALFKLSDREDAIGVEGDDGGKGVGRLQKIDEIRLYSKPEYEDFEEALEDEDPDNDPGIDQLSPIKTAYFEYDYSLCGNLPNNTEAIIDVDGVNINAKKGKLTLKKVYFTYRTSLMGKHTPYKFSYNEDDPNYNPDYSLKAFDIWGNYKPNSEQGCETHHDITTSEFPFVDQGDKTTQNQYAAAWSLTTIDLPSGGSIELTYESDDYQYVQDKPTMQMFKVVGAGGSNNPINNPEDNQLLYNGPEGEAKYLYVELPDEDPNNLPSKQLFLNKYLKDLEDKPIYFRFLMNMTRKGAKNNNSRDYDYVTGYFQLDKGILDDPDPTKNLVFKNSAGDRVYAAIPMELTRMEGGIINGNKEKNPITKAGLYFGRTYLNKVVHGIKEYRPDNVVSIAKKLAKSIGSFAAFFQNPNEQLRKKGCAQRFIPEKSWVRLSTPEAYKLGGGARVKKLEMNDNWNTMEPTNGSYQKYGQMYSYTLEDDSSSGVATFEPNDSAENPFVEPFYDADEKDLIGERFIAPREVSYIEKPFGKAFFPYSKVTYSRVTVKNLERDDIKRHATGKVVSEFYTTKDFPTKVDHTDITKNGFVSNQNRVLQNMLKGIFGLEVAVKNQFTLSQGYVIHTNDMDGKMKSQSVYQEGMDTPISSVEYKYSTKGVDLVNNELANVSILDNVLPVIAKNGTVSDKEIGVDYDVVTDFRESYSKSKTTGVNVNVATLFIGFIPVIVPTAFPSRSKHENIAHSVITTKVIHTTSILKEKTAMDLGSKVSTVNEAWDAETGQVILTKTINEYDDTYYNFNFPAYWADTYKNMGQASKNIGFQGALDYSGGYFTLLGATKASDYLTLGDEIIAHDGITPKRLWIVEFSEDESGIKLMDRHGALKGSSEEDIDFKVVRSGYRNQQMGNMASMTMMTNPLDLLSPEGKINTASFSQAINASASNNKRIINASAVAYDDFWNAQCENGLKSIPYKNLGTDSIELADKALEDYDFNPYLYNVRGEWRAEKSYAYLTERTDVKQGAETSKTNTRKEGYFKEFIPFYALDESGNDTYWKPNTTVIDENNPDEINHWTFASEVTQYSPYGAELENKDALNRYSSAQYGYNFTLPVAVTSNSKYRYMGADNFEDYDDYINTAKGHFTYKDIVDQDGHRGVVTSNKHAHTGHTSLLIDPANSSGANLPVELVGELPPSEDYDGDEIKNEDDKCPYTYSKNNNGDYDGNGIGDACDEQTIPKITNIAITKQLNWWLKQSSFTIQGKPHDEVKYRVNNIKTGAHGWGAHLNEGDMFFNKPLGESSEIQTVTLDATGRANFILEMKVRHPRKYGDRAYQNYTSLEFVLLNQKDDNQLLSSPTVELEVVGYKDSRSGTEPGATYLFGTKF